MKATAKYILDTPGAGEIGEVTTANLDRREFTSIRKRKIFRCVDIDSILGIISSPLIFLHN
ncbi:hypothetical protein [Methanosarcina horonobensis]|uniref:hypothetical protein n=1 Tax=Methanosarcina horonobensis TaxID=418008 RepID=UPI0022B88E0B|nr:hypothetical protein [Methanosarcina horonobensis]